MYSRVYLKIFFASIFIIKCNKATKYWINNPEFLDPNNWEDGHPPCSADRIIFPQEFSAGIFLPSTLIIDGLVLPRNGALLPGSKMNIIFTSGKDKDKTCKNKSNLAKIKKTKTKFWFDINNWNSSSQNPATPHINRIPCSNEDVIMNPQGAVSIDLDEASNLYLGDFILGEQHFSARQLQHFLNTELGQVVFKQADYAGVRFSKGSQCGCHLSNAISEVQTKVCKYVKNTCLIPKCVNPVTPTGHCCAVCGALLKVYVDDCEMVSRRFDDMKNKLKNFVHSSKYQNEIDFDAEMIDDGRDKYFQLIILDKNDYDEKSVNFMGVLNETTLFHIFFRDLRKVFLESGLPIDPQGGASFWVFIFSTFFAVITFFIVIYAYYIPENPYIRIPAWLYPSRYNIFSSPFVFARFEDTQSRVEVQGNVVMNVTYEEEEGTTESGTTSFNNPMFKQDEQGVEVAQESTSCELTQVSLITPEAD